MLKQQDTKCESDSDLYIDMELKTRPTISSYFFNFFDKIRLWIHVRKKLKRLKKKDPFIYK